jgi:sugar phosphate isomerase/epimerase
VPLGPGDLVLCSGTINRESTFEQRVAAARAGGFDGISLWGRDYRAARDSGSSDADLRTMLGDNGLEVAELDLVWRWLPGTADIRVPAALDTEDIFSFEEGDLFAIAESVGARSVNAVDIFGGKWAIPAATDSFAALCRRAAEHGLLVHLEFLPWSKIGDLKTAWQIVRDAGEPNGGIAVDAWHYFGSAANDLLLGAIPGDKVTSIQLSDAPAVAGPSFEPMHASLHERLLPGDGSLDLAALVECCSRVNAKAPIGIEVFSDSLHALDPTEAGRLAGDSLRKVIERSRAER